MRLTFFLVVIVFLVNATFKHGVLEPLLFAVALAGLVVGYLVTVEVVKVRFFADRL
ncbi:MAG: hypothetical protein GX885_00145 [Methanomicrobiales archaeon]|nr:hypothetical protein [Methanomicrobiales archaeon]